MLSGLFFDPATPTLVYTTTTASDGSYHFQQLPPGTYSITEIGPSGRVDAKDTLGTAGGTVGHDTFTGVALGQGVNATGYDFGWQDGAGVHQHADFAGRRRRLLFLPGDGGRRRRRPVDVLPVARPRQFDGVRDRPGVLARRPARAPSSHPITLQVSDGRGGFARQPYNLTVTPSSINTPPYFTSTPIVSGTVGLGYSYPAAAADPDGDVLTFSVMPVARRA